MSVYEKAILDALMDGTVLNGKHTIVEPIASQITKIEDGALFFAPPIKVELKEDCCRTELLDQDRHAIFRPVVRQSSLGYRAARPASVPRRTPWPAQPSRRCGQSSSPCRAGAHHPRHAPPH